jgi:hypothetical protein
MPNSTTVTIPTSAEIEACSQTALNFVQAQVEHVHGVGTTVPMGPEFTAIEALCVLIGGLMAKNRELERQVADFTRGPA